MISVDKVAADVGLSPELLALVYAEDASPLAARVRELLELFVRSQDAVTWAFLCQFALSLRIASASEPVS